MLNQHCWLLSYVGTKTYQLPFPLKYQRLEILGWSILPDDKYKPQIKHLPRAKDAQISPKLLCRRVFKTFKQNWWLSQLVPSLRSSFSVLFLCWKRWKYFLPLKSSPLWCRGESTTCLQGRVLQLHSGEWYSTYHMWGDGAVPHCTSCLQGRVVATGRWLRLPSHNSMVCFTKYLVHCSIVLGMLHLVPGTVLLGTNKPYNRSSGPPCRLLYFCTPQCRGPAATQLFVIQSLMGSLSP